jgi:hypothetical protein
MIVSIKILYVVSQCFDRFFTINRFFTIDRMIFFCCSNDNNYNNNNNNNNNNRRVLFARDDRILFVCLRRSYCLFATDVLFNLFFFFDWPNSLLVAFDWIVTTNRYDSSSSSFFTRSRTSDVVSIDTRRFEGNKHKKFNSQRVNLLCHKIVS